MKTFSKYTVVFALLATALTVFEGTSILRAHALWKPWAFLHRGASSSTVSSPAVTEFPPPNKLAIATQCDPIRELIVEKNQTTGLRHLWLRPGIGRLKKRYFDCLHRIQNQEFEYLKHTDLQARPVDNAFKDATQKK